MAFPSGLIVPTHLHREGEEVEESRTVQSKLEQRQQTESTRQKGSEQEERSRPEGTVSRQENEQGR